MRRSSWLLALAVVACEAEQPKTTASATAPSASMAGPTATPSASGSTAPTASASSKSPTVGAFVTRKEAREAGLPDVGVRVDDVWTGFTAIKAPRAGTYLSLGGPPGGTLMFVVRGHTGEADADGVSSAYRSYLKEAKAIADPLLEGSPERVTLAGAERPARAFITGSAPARANWCVILVASPRKTDEGLMVMAGVGVPDAVTDPACKRSLEHEHIRPLVASLTVE
jgi:hypothetical protein